MLPRLAELHPEATAELARVNAVARSIADPELLDLCRRRAEAMLARAPWEEPAAVTDRERAFLDFTEQFVTSVSHVSDEDVERLLEHATPAEVYDFIGALYVVEMTRRVEMVASEVLR
jgi:transposase